MFVLVVASIYLVAIYVLLRLAEERIQEKVSSSGGINSKQ